MVWVLAVETLYTPARAPRAEESMQHGENSGFPHVRRARYLLSEPRRRKQEAWGKGEGGDGQRGIRGRREGESRRPVWHAEVPTESNLLNIN